MIGPVSILSLAAVSAAEATSSGKRGLREPVNMMWPIGIIGASALLGFLVGAIPFYFIGKSGSSGGMFYPLPKTAMPHRVIVRFILSATGCRKGSYQSEDLVTTGTVYAAACEACPQFQTTPSDTAFAAKAPEHGTEAKINAICSLCADNAYGVADGCDSCGAGKTRKKGVDGTPKTVETESDVCFPKCTDKLLPGRRGETVPSALGDGEICICGEDKAECTKAHSQCDRSASTCKA